MRTPQRTIDFNKVQWADYWWQNQDGARVRCKPNWISVHTIPIEPNNYARPHAKFPNETNLERAKRLDVLDKWHPVCNLVLGANKHLRFTGTKATSIWKAYNAHIYGK